MRQTIEATVLTTPEATVVEVEGSAHLETYRGNLKATGYAKKHPNDEHDAEVGHALAMARALRDLAEKYEKRAWARINTATVTSTPDTVFTYATGGMLRDDYQLRYPVQYTLKGNITDSWAKKVIGRS